MVNRSINCLSLYMKALAIHYIITNMYLHVLYCVVCGLWGVFVSVCVMCVAFECVWSMYVSLCVYMVCSVCVCKDCTLGILWIGLWERSLIVPRRPNSLLSLCRAIWACGREPCDQPPRIDNLLS